MKSRGRFGHCIEKLIPVRSGGESNDDQQTPSMATLFFFLFLRKVSKRIDSICATAFLLQRGPRTVLAALKIRHADTT